MTTAWVKLLATHQAGELHEIHHQPNNEYRLTPALLQSFWTPAVLESEAARLGWVPPDKKALPN